LAAGQSRTVTLTARVSTTPPDGTLLYSIATVVSNEGFSATDEQVVVVDNTPALRVSLEEDQDPVPSGGRLNYTIRFANGTTTEMTGVALRVPVPLSTTFAAASEGVAPSGGVVEWGLGTLKGGENGVRRLSVTVDDGLANGSLVRAEAELRAGAVAAQSRAATVVDEASPLVLSMTASRDPVRPGEQVTYTVTVANRGAGPLTGVVVTALVPDWVDSFSESSGLSSGGQCPGACDRGETASWAVGTLAAGQSRTVTLTARVSTTPPDGTLLYSIAHVVHPDSGASAASAAYVRVGRNWPALDPISDRTIDELRELSFTATATDADIPFQTLTYTLGIGAPSGAGIHPSTGVFTWMPSEVQGPGTYAITVRVTDSGSPPLSDERTFQVTVNEVNAPPVLAAVGNKTVAEDSLLTFTAMASDPDRPTLQTLAYSLDPGAPTGASIDSATGVFTWTPTEAQGPGEYVLTLRVTDSGDPALSDSETITVTVIAPRPTVGLTVITHGFQLIGFPDWPIDMAKEIIAAKGGGHVILLEFDTGEASVPIGQGSTAELNSAGPTVVVLDWADKSHKLWTDLQAAEPGWREAAGDFLANYLLGTGLARSANERNAPIHFIGHSFGTVVNSEAIRRLGLYDISVFRMTTLDPHDQDQVGVPDAQYDPAVSVWTNVTDADNYWQDNAGLKTDPRDNFDPPKLLPVGHSLPAAYNRDLTEQTAFEGLDLAWQPHSRVWAWFFKTIAGNDYRDESLREIVGRNWYPNAPPTMHGYGLNLQSDFAYLKSLGMEKIEAQRTNPKNIPPATVFNGDFQFVGGDLLSLNVPGFVDGNEPKLVDTGDTEHSFAAELFDASRTFSTRPIYFPPDASYVQFEYSVPWVSGKVAVILEGSDGLVGVREISAGSPRWLFERVPVPESLRGHRAGLKLSAQPLSLGSGGSILVDNLRILRAPAATTRLALEVRKDPAEGGTVTATPEAVDYAQGELVSLTATANPGYYLDHWSGVDAFSGDLAQVILSSARTVMAVFKKRTGAEGFSCPAEYASGRTGARLAGAGEPIDLSLLRRFRDEVLAATPEGRDLIEQFYRNSTEVIHHMAADPAVFDAVHDAIVTLQPTIRDLVEGTGEAVVSEAQVQAVQTVLEKLLEPAGVVLDAAIRSDLERVGPLEGLVGQTSSQARLQVLGPMVRLRTPRLTAAGEFEFTVEGDLVGTVRVEYSTDLRQWQALDTPALEQLPAVVRDPRPIGSAGRYYRVVLAP
jgi:uncharacterized repeat protein (TIGR01451 family)